MQCAISFATNAYHAEIARAEEQFDLHWGDDFQFPVWRKWFDEPGVSDLPNYPDLAANDCVDYLRREFPELDLRIFYDSTSSLKPSGQLGGIDEVMGKAIGWIGVEVKHV